MRVFQILLLLLGSIVPSHAAEPELSPLVISVSERNDIFPARSKASGEIIAPGVEVYLDGTVTIKRRSGLEIVRHLAPARVQELLKFLEREKLFEITPKRMKEEFDRAPSSLATDQATTTLFAVSAGRKVTLSQYGLALAVQYLDSPSVQVMYRCTEKIYQTAGERP
jgi:hypothetical protein